MHLLVRSLKTADELFFTLVCKLIPELHYIAAVDGQYNAGGGRVRCPSIHRPSLDFDGALVCHFKATIVRPLFLFFLKIKLDWTLFEMKSSLACLLVQDDMLLFVTT